MKQIINHGPTTTVFLDNIPCGVPIFAKKHNKLIGMMVLDPDGWILRTGHKIGATGHHETRQLCIDSCYKIDSNYSFHIEEF